MPPDKKPEAMTPEEVRQIVVEALGNERAALFEQLIASNHIEPGFAYNVLLLQLYGLRLSDDLGRHRDADGRLVLALTAIAKVTDQIELQTRNISGQLSGAEKASRDTADAVRQLAARLPPVTKARKSSPNPGFLVSGGAVIAALLCAIFWNLGYQRGAHETAFADAMLARKNPTAWSRFVRSEVGK